VKPPPVPGSRKDRTRQLLTFVGVAIILVSLPTIGVLEYQSNQSQNDHHASTIKKDDALTKKDDTIIAQGKEMKALLKEVATAQADGHAKLTDLSTLEKEVATVILGLPPTDAALGKFAQWLEICVGQDHEVDCPSPPIPTS
jgi:hypothetical protein